MDQCKSITTTGKTTLETYAWLSGIRLCGKTGQRCVSVSLIFDMLYVFVVQRNDNTKQRAREISIVCKAHG